MPTARAPLRKARVEMDLRRFSAGSVQSLGHYSYAYARPPLREHRHARALEICFLAKGRQTYRVHGEDFHLRGGDVFFTRPNESHGTGGAPEEKGELFWMTIAEPKEAADFLGLPGPMARSLWRSIERMPRRHFRGSGRLKEALDAVTLAYHGASNVRDVVIYHELTGFFLELVRCAQAAVGGATPLAAVRQHMRERLDETLSVADLARMAQLSPSRFKARFKEETGVPPAEYHLRLRMAEAQRRLRTRRQSVTEVAFALGFSSSQYFATVFKRYTGQTPVRWQAAHR